MKRWNYSVFFLESIIVFMEIVLYFLDERPRPTEPPGPTPPTITVTISSPVIEIVDVGNTVRLDCQGFNIVKQVRSMRETVERVVLKPLFLNHIQQVGRVHINSTIIIFHVGSDHSSLAQTGWTSTGSGIRRAWLAYHC